MKSQLHVLLNEGRVDRTLLLIEPVQELREQALATPVLQLRTDGAVHLSRQAIAPRLQRLDEIGIEGDGYLSLRDGAPPAATAPLALLVGAGDSSGGRAASALSSWRHGFKSRSGRQTNSRAARVFSFSDGQFIRCCQAVAIPSLPLASPLVDSLVAVASALARGEWTPPPGGTCEGTGELEGSRCRAMPRARPQPRSRATEPGSCEVLVARASSRDQPLGLARPPGSGHS